MFAFRNIFQISDCVWKKYVTSSPLVSGASISRGCWRNVGPALMFRAVRYFCSNCDLANITTCARAVRAAEGSARGTSGASLARSLIAINHCQNSATRRTTRAAGYYHQSRVLRDQRDARRARGQGEGPSETRNPFDTSENSARPLYAPLAFTRIHVLPARTCAQAPPRIRRPNREESKRNLGVTHTQTHLS